MNTSYHAPIAVSLQQNTTTPNLASLVLAELFKIVHNRGAWVTTIILLPVLALWGLHYLGVVSLTNFVPGQFLSPGLVVYTLALEALADVRGFIGIFLMVLTVIVVGLEYQQGTIRVLLARGVGRMRLLTAKLLAIGIAGLIIMPVMMLIVGIMAYVDLMLSGHTDWLSQAPDYLWPDIGTYVLTILISMVATILLAAAITTLGRSLAIGFGLTLPWFPLESVVGVILLVTAEGVRNNIWYGITDYFIGTNLSRLPTVLLADHISPIAGILMGDLGSATNILSTDPFHLYIVIAVYCAVFLLIAYFLTWKRDVTQ